MFLFGNTLCSITVNQSSFRTQKEGGDLDTYSCSKWNQSMVYPCAQSSWMGTFIGNKYKQHNQNIIYVYSDAATIPEGNKQACCSLG